MRETLQVIEMLRNIDCYSLKIISGKVPPDCSPSYPNPMWPDTDFQHNIVVCAKRTVMNGGKAPNSCLEDLTGGLKRFAGHGKNVILSDEVFSLRAIEKDPLKAPIIESMFLFLVDMLESWDVQVVTVYRRYYEWSMSVYNHLNKHTKSRKLGKKWPGKEGGREVIYPVHWFEANGNFKGQSFYPYTNDAKFKDFFPVTVLNIHGEIDVSEQFICHALDNANHACRSIRSTTSYTEEASTRNPSVSLNYDMLAIEAHRLKLLKDGLQREKVGNVARYFHENITRRENDDFDFMTCIPRHLLDNILNKSIDRERENFPDLLGSKMSENRLKNDFEEFVKSGRFCNVDTKQLIKKDLKWHSFFTSLGRGGPKDLYNVFD